LPEPADILPSAEDLEATQLRRDAGMLGAVLDACPSATFVVDADARVLFLNPSARRLLGMSGDADARKVLGRRGGDLLGCLNALSTPSGCGRAPACSDCVIRNSVRRAVAGGAVHRARTFLQVERPEGLDEVHFLVSAAPARHEDRRLVVLTLEDLSEFALFTSLVPICCHCRKVLDRQQGWTTVEEYFKARADVDFTHALCGECLDRHYPTDGGAEDAPPRGTP
jgi:PAS domain-containing protein